MSQAIPSPAECCSECPVPAVDTNIPGPAGPAGADGTNGTDGINAFTETTDSFEMPPIGDDVTVYVVDSTWVQVGQILFIESAGYFTVVSKPDGVSLVLTNDGDDNAVPTTVIASGKGVSPAGQKGEQGTGSGDLLAANNLNDVANVAASRTSLGVTATGADGSYCKVANNLNDVANVVTARASLGLAIGTNVQAYSAYLTSVAGLTVIADRLPYGSAANTALLTAFTAAARALLDDATATEMRVTLGYVMPRKGLLGSIMNANMNLAGDVAVPITASRYRVTAMVVENGITGISLTTATAGLFSAAAGVGTIVADQALAAITAVNMFKECAVSSTGLTTIFTGANLYFRIGTPQGVAAISNIWIFGEDYTP